MYKIQYRSKDKSGNPEEWKWETRHTSFGHFHLTFGKLYEAENECDKLKRVNPGIEFRVVGPQPY